MLHEVDSPQKKGCNDLEVDLLLNTPILLHPDRMKEMFHGVKIHCK